MQKTNIEYLTHSWNLIAMRCEPVSRGCNRCWHLRRADMLAHNPKIPDREQWAYAPKPHTRDPVLRIKELSAPMRRKKPARIGVQFMGDLFHPSISFEWIAAAVSYEPALGKIEIEEYLSSCFECGNFGSLALGFDKPGSGNDLCRACGRNYGSAGIDFLVAGAETGPGARPAELDWFRSVRDQCVAAGVPFFFKRDSSGSRLLDGRMHEEL